MSQPTPIDEFQVYMAWPEETILQQLDVFKNGENGIYNGAGPAELTAGLHCLDFLTRKSPMSENTRAILDGAVMEAEMRIDLMLQLERSEQDRQQLIEKAIQVVEQLQRQVRNITQRARWIDREELQEIIRRRIGNR
ncbi:TPA: hypothetical protein L3689_001750 [Pseudomonas aeruginosa]|nr:hypothetical protein [Pseudomonas aeruginosa]HEP7922819.1 hypothetical protein [Pseudomonas aeruginosa]